MWTVRSRINPGPPPVKPSTRPPRILANPRDLIPSHARPSLGLPHLPLPPARPADLRCPPAAPPSSSGSGRPLRPLSPPSPPPVILCPFACHSILPAGVLALRRPRHDVALLERRRQRAHLQQRCVLFDCVPSRVRVDAALALPSGPSGGADNIEAVAFCGYCVAAVVVFCAADDAEGTLQGPAWRSCHAVPPLDLGVKIPFISSTDVKPAENN
ncbi:unnamed protein product [Urochloa humidicola]